MRRWPSLLLALLIQGVLCLSGGAPARAQFTLVPGYADGAAAGPTKAKGAVIWNHGKEADRVDDFGETPFFLDTLRESGWDVFRLLRKREADNLENATAALIEEAEKLKLKGYGRIVAAGQSFGGWISYAAATRTSGLLHAIVANAPAAFGQPSESPYWQLNADRLYALAQDIRSTRIMTFFFQRDPYDPGGRGRRLQEILAAKGLPHVVIDQRPGLEGHEVGGTLAFARTYDRCIRDFVELPRLPEGFDCTATGPRAVAADFPPAASRTAPMRAAPGVGQVFGGRWFGWYTQGRELLLIVREIRGNRVSAMYAWSALGRGPGEGAGYSMRQGHIDPQGGLMVFDEPGQARLEFARRRDGWMDVVWTRGDGGLRIVGVARRVD